MTLRSNPTRAPGGRSRWVVLKFGGTSVSTADRWRTIAEVLRIRLEEDVRPLVVCSALAGVSDMLEDILHQAEQGRMPEETLEQLAERHERLGADLGIDVDGLIGPYLRDVKRLVDGARMIREVSSRLRARVMSAGELMSTRLGAAWLTSRGIPTGWADARDLLVAETPPVTSDPWRRYVSATCSYEIDPTLGERLAALDKSVVITQGFIGRDADSGATVLLGRGGSDTSASYLAARLNARRLEIWTDVPGMFTANPRSLPDARLLRHLAYDEAQMLAAMGARVLHPRCIPPVRSHGIPLHVRSTKAAHIEGTIISDEAAAFDPSIKAVASRDEVILMRMGYPGQWQSVGLLAEVTGAFSRHGLSIDSLATSPSRISVTLDPAASPLTALVERSLVEELEDLCTPEIHRETASVSLVGHSIGAVVHRLGPGLESLTGGHVKQINHAANDHAISFVVEQGEVDGLVDTLHRWLLSVDLPKGIFGPPWNELMAAEKAAAEGQTEQPVKAASRRA
ncbi:MAG: aspartate kinase [Myxococcota bacterium]